MKCFVAQLTEDRHINILADRMELREETILAYDGDNLVAVLDIGATLSAHLSEKVAEDPTSTTQEQETPETPIHTPEPKPQPEQRPEPPETGYKGFLYIKCESCGYTKGFCTKQPIKETRCNCGHFTKLRNLKSLYVNCKCGETFKYRTNLTDRMATINCLKCGSPVDLEYHDKKNLYATIGHQKED